MGDWFVYILECMDGTYYTGITRDLTRRVKEHREGVGAKYTKSKGARGLLWCMPCANRSMASKHEAKIKAMTKADKKKLIDRTGALLSDM